MTKKYNTFLPRLMAGFIDGLVLTPLVICDYLILKPDTNLKILIPWLIISYLAFFVYSIFLHWKYGQTVGKALVGVSVIDVSESKELTFNQAFLRESVPFFIQIILIIKLVYITIGKGHYDEIEIVNSASLINDVVAAWFIIEVITMLTNKKRRALHDFIAKTVVIRDKA